MVKNQPAMQAFDQNWGLIPELGRCHGDRNGNPV